MADAPAATVVKENPPAMASNGVNSPQKTPNPNAAVPDLFGESTASGATASSDSNVVNAVVSKSSPTGKTILGPKPKTSSGLDVRPSGFNFSSFLFKLSILAALVTFGFFYTQLNPTFALFGKNPVQSLADLETSVQEEQTTTNLYNLLIAKFALDDFSTDADAYLYSYAQYESAYTSSNTKAQLAVDLGNLNDEMKVSLLTVQTKLNQTLYPKDLAFTADSVTDLEQEYEILLKTRIDEEKQTLETQSDEESSIEYTNLESVLALLNEDDFARQVKSLDLDQDLDLETIQTLFAEATSISKNEISTILNIKNSRVDWSNVLDEIKEVTREVDPLYASGITSNIEYTSFTFDSSDQTIMLRGVTRTDDTLNFSLISDLIDELEASTLFANVTNRSFTKTEDQSVGYTSSFSINLSLQDGEDERDKILSSQTSNTEESEATEEVDEEVTEELIEETVVEDTESAESDEILVEEEADTTIEETTEDTDVSLSGANFLNMFDLFVEQISSHSAPTRIPRTP